MAEYPPQYPYPRFITHEGDRLHPGTLLVGGGPKHDYPELRAGKLWRVSSPMGYPGVLYLVSVTQPGYFLRLNLPGEHSWPPAAPGVQLGHMLAWALVRVEHTDWFSYARMPDWYQKFKDMGCTLWVVPSPTDPYVVVFVESEELPFERGFFTATVSTLQGYRGRPVPDEENRTLYGLWFKMKDALDAWEKEKLRLLRQEHQDFYSVRSGRLDGGLIIEPLSSQYRRNDWGTTGNL